MGAALMRRWFLGQPFSMPHAWKNAQQSKFDYRMLPPRLFDPMDDLYCALGAFTLHVAASGTVHPIQNASPNGATHAAHMYDNGSGYLNLVDGNGRTLAKSTFSDSVVVGPIVWEEDCTSVIVGADDGRVILEASPEHPRTDN